MKLFRALRSRNYRLFFIGQGLSLIGTWMQRVALGWLVFRLTGSEKLLGVVSFASMIPGVLLAPVAGVLADRVDRRKLIIITQILSMLQAFLMAFLVFSDLVQTWHIIFLATLMGIISSFDIPTRQSFVVQMVDDKDHVGNAIALNSMIFNGARLVGPTIAGFVIAKVGEDGCFLLNGVSYLAVIVSLWMMRVPPLVKVEQKHPLHDLAEGFKYVHNYPSLKLILLVVSASCILALPYNVLLPVFADKVLHGDARSMGFLTSASGIGAMLGAWYLGSRRNALGLEKVIMRTTLLLGAALIFFSLSRIFWLSFVTLIFVGFGTMVSLASANTVIQTIIPDNIRGRVVSLYIMTFMGVSPFGSLLSGWLAERISAPNTMLIFGAVLVLLTILVIPRYHRLGTVIEKSV